MNTPALSSHRPDRQPRPADPLSVRPHPMTAARWRAVRDARAARLFTERCCHARGRHAGHREPYARRSGNGPHLMFAGHTDVVPGRRGGLDASALCRRHRQWCPVWPRRGRHEGRHSLFRRAAVARHIARHGTLEGSVSLLITATRRAPQSTALSSCSNGPAERGETWDAAIVGEPTNPDALGDMIKIGRRGSVSGKVTVHGCRATSPIRIWPTIRCARLPTWPQPSWIRPLITAPTISSRQTSRSRRSTPAIRRPT